MEFTTGAASLVPYYNGLTDSVCSFSRLQQFLREMDHAQLTGNLSESRAAARNLQARYVATATVPLALLHFEYANLKPYALDSLIGYNSVDSAFYLLSGVAESPFQAHRLFAMAPLQPGRHGGDFNFVLGSMIGNASEVIISYSADFGDGAGFRAVVPGQSVAVQYTTAGLKQIILVATTANGTLTAITEFRVGSLASSPQLSCGEVPTVPITTIQDVPNFCGNVTATIAAPKPCGYVGSDIGSARYYVQYSSPTTHFYIRKPIVFVEGIDFGNVTGAGAAYRTGDFGWDILATGIWQDGTEDQNLVQMPQLLNSLLAAGYDIVLIDFDDGADLIQKNAFALVRLLEILRDNPHRTEETVVVGTSMGGLVSRFALAYMEKHNMPHCTRLWGSFDSPHKGANIPLGVQHFVNFFAEHSDIDEVHKGQDKLQKPAAKQMMVYHESGSCYYDQFYTQLNSLGHTGSGGFPKRLRKIAVANGSRTATQQSFNAGDMIIDYEFNYPSVLSFLAKHSSLKASKPYNPKLKRK